MKPFVVNNHDRLVFPANFLGELDFSVIDDLEQFTAIVGRDFGAKAPTGTDILERVTNGAYESRFALLRDMSQNLFWVNRYTLTMFEKRPTRWRDLPRHRADVFLPLLTPWRDGDKKIRAVADAFAALPTTWDEETERRIFDLLFDVYGNRRPPRDRAARGQADRRTVPHHARRADLRRAPPRPGLPSLLLHRDPRRARRAPRARGPDPVGDGAAQPVPLGPCLHRAAHRRGDRRRRVRHRLPPAQPRRRAVPGPRHWRPSGAARPALHQSDPVEPVAPLPPIRVREAFAVQPKVEALAVVRGEHVCSNDDVVRNSAFSWSPMSADEIAAKTASTSAATPSSTSRTWPGPQRSARLSTPAATAPRSAPCSSPPAPASGSSRRCRRGCPVAWACCRRTARPTSSPPAPGCPTACPRPCASCRR